MISLALRGVALLLAIPALAQTPRVILISVDGLRPDAIRDDTAPALIALAARGAHGVALNDLPSATLPNHTSMLTGLPASEHGVLVDFAIAGHVEWPTILTIAHDAGLRTAFFASKSKLEYLATPGAIETTLIADPEDLIPPLLAALQPDGPDLIFVHLRDPDSTGHVSGWLSDAYLAAVVRMDALIRQIVQAADADDTHTTYFLVTSDHGGMGLNHFLNIPEDRRIPWILAGGALPAGAALTADSLSTLDTAPTVLTLLGIAVPNSLRGVERVSELLDPAEPPVARDPDVPAVGPACVLFPLFSLAVAITLFRAARQTARACPPSRP